MNKLDGKILHYVAFHNMEDITAINHPSGTNLFLGCGSSRSNLGFNYFKITSEGQKLFYRRYKSSTDPDKLGETKC